MRSDRKAIRRRAAGTLSTAIAAAVEHALRAPSVFNTQPWTWRIHGEVVRLYADRDRQLVAYDPHGRALVLSCGAALHHLKVALAGRGYAVRIDRLPDAEDSDHLATVVVGPGPGDAVDAALYPQIDRRHTQRRHLSPQPVPPSLLQELVDLVQGTGAVLVAATDPVVRHQLLTVLTDVAATRRLAPDAAAEVHQWTHRYIAAHDGVAAAELVPPLGFYDHPVHLPALAAADGAGELLLVVTAHDGPRDWLRAGEATSAVLLAAGGMGLATTPLTQGIEIEASRSHIRWHLLHLPEHPQIVIKVGWPATDSAADVPLTARRDMRFVVRP